MKGYHHLTQRQRYIIEDLKSLGKSKSEISREVGVNRSTITREFNRNSNQKGGYKALGAQGYANHRRLTSAECRHKIEGLLEELVTEKLSLGWSPEQICGRLKLEGRWQLSHETIYRWIYTQQPGYKTALRFGRRRQKRVLRNKRRGLEKYPRKLIDQRPSQANKRSELGHWERDLLEGLRGETSLLVLNDRKSRLTKIIKVESHHCLHVNDQTVKAIGDHACETVTNDNGIEFGKYEDLETKLSVPVYYCHAYSSWERGTVENTNGLIRQFYPKKTNFNKVSQEHIKSVEQNLNSRPRKIFNFRTPEEIHYAKNRKLIKSKTVLYKNMNERNERLERELFRKFTAESVAIGC
jgi:IS30 family transposase